ncbi:MULTISPECIES: alpha/beta fold hydrolase [unclassified Luteimonas]|uniref:alpha/beta fold hydrolase n=1 Tax=unclassified Luteimonas TaxID=2629088 RepID=UPI0018F09B25|nr:MULTISPECIES: alpha/beta fold hydrolase [unclassified Luteimonas]MBJ6979215.1 alpha/beta fold hydrolase [Luteimonas sp. MC1895]MBJ6985232.1 alpha/beta fold hydrolase [Luteimonas sp. MC1750]QQO05878.1 alpha/beta fold hydrolase [Luteimonas sp. MC1750]
MSTRGNTLATLLAAALAAGCAAPDSGTAGGATPDGHLRVGDIAFEPCSLSAVGARAVEAQCAHFEVPEDHDAPDGRRIGLALALLPSEGPAEPDPVVMIAGGPGQSALESYPQVAAAFKDVRRNRHVLLVDARGTGQSHPLRCEDEQGDNAFGAEDLDPAAMRAFTERCRDALAVDTDLRRYATMDHVRDLERVREALGAPQFNLAGVSYGTRVAQQYAKAFPASTRTVVLDGVAPNAMVLGQEHARNLEQALDAQFARCRDEPACARNLGDPAAQLRAVRATLEAGGLPPVQYRHPVSGEWLEEQPAFAHLAVLLRMFSYQPAAAATLPLLLHEASAGRYAPMLAQSRMLMDSVGGQMAHGMQLSVICTEDAMDMAPDPGDAGSLLGNSMVELFQAQCPAWPTAPRAEGFRDPLTGDVPVLAISGEFDPVTPPRYGEEVIGHLPKGRHLVAPGQGHNVIGVGCMPKLFAQFIERADAAGIDASCLDRLAAAPPFAGNYGWEP